VSSEAQVRDLVRRALERLGRVDVLVNNAGVIGPMAPVAEAQRDDWDRALGGRPDRGAIVLSGGAAGHAGPAARQDH